jgi:tryptophanyl-tRNA synthetase
MAHRVIFSGIQPTGRLHLGNYLGAVKQWCALGASTPPTPTSRLFFSIVDLHALTASGAAPEPLSASTFRMAASLMACGLAPSASRGVHLFAQSAVREHTELAWLLACRTPLGHLQRMAQFKSKSGAARAAASLGLLSYPVLQAADILLYRATHVPVGEDQEQHLELAREVADVVNAAWGGGGGGSGSGSGGGGGGGEPFFPRPLALALPSGGAARVMSLRDGAAKMSKSDPADASRVNMDDSDAAIAAKVRAAKTDSSRGFSPLDEAARPEKANLVRVLAALRGASPEAVAAQFADAPAAEFKDALTAALVDTVAPIRARLAHLTGEGRGEVERALREGAEAAREAAAHTMREVRARVGYA